MIWTPAIQPVVCAVALLFLSGTPVTVAAGIRGPLKLLLTPITAIGVLAGAAIVLGHLHASYTPINVTLFLLTAAASTYALRKLVAKALAWSSRTGDAELQRINKKAAAKPITCEPSSYLLIFASLGISLLLWARIFISMLGKPDAISQTYDAIFHLTGIRHILDSSNASSLTFNNLGETGSGEFYPAAWHAAASLIAQLSGASVPLSANALTFAICALIWPCSTLALLWVMGANQKITLFATPAICASFASFPLLLTDFGVLYPNLLGLSLVGAMAALVHLLFVDTTRSQTGLPGVLLIGLWAGIAITLSHPTTLHVTGAVAVLVLLFQTLNPKATLKTRGFYGLLTVVTLLLTWKVWLLLRPVYSGWEWPPTLTEPQAIGEVILFGIQKSPASWAAALLTAVGVFAACKIRDSHWLPAMFFFTGFLYTVAASWNNAQNRQFWVWPWYSDSYRLGAQIVVFAAPLAALSTLRIYEACSRKLKADTRLIRLRKSPLLPVTFIVILAILLQTSASLEHGIEQAQKTYSENPDSPLLSSDERELINQLGKLIPPGAVVVTDPWNGSSLTYALTGIKTTTTHPGLPLRGGMHYLTEHLNNAADDPQVCHALSALGGAKYVLSFGDPEINNEDHPWPGFSYLRLHRGFEMIAKKGNASLYRITACTKSADSNG
ncbi:DUF6541 family protein [Dermabacteraceae bacterium P7006]